MESSTFLSGSTAHLNCLSQTPEKPSKEQVAYCQSTGRNIELSSGSRKRIRDFTETRSISKTKGTRVKSDGLLSFFKKLEIIEAAAANKNYFSALQYFNQDETLKEIQQLSQYEQTLLANNFFHSKSIRKTFNTIAGRYLATLPTTDQFLVGVIGSILESCLAGIKGSDDYFTYIWKNVDVFIKNNSFHLPEKFINSIPYRFLNEEAIDFFGFDSDS